MMKRHVAALVITCVVGLGGCEPRPPEEPVVETSPAMPGEERPPATTRAASQPPAVPVEELVDTVPGPPPAP